ncbi:GPO family capsid scaffolding protein [Marinibactrum halimedae]|uniref:Phage capsid scaffolding protein n=1 Tax=Marinibactrum halimedae TaxID=1444977 RepID=A0AA37WNG8_9GAMM|nr:GPO family capsid scaffolding protein [Marinibactrum halimedae]MCD9458469.1 GPO family capsid scaffolding protein [Marinibactrum halimedae]GLS26166.1 phage capsid scaffolding protein [Marinibactrum halimedae]
MARELKTGWVKIATSGATVDGRVIEKEWLEAMANNYDREVHTAKIWLDHYRFLDNGGKVLALKTEAATNDHLKGEMHLLAILAPNDFLIELNRQGQYVNCSIEVNKNFMDGKFDYYLGGLGATDDQASAGTTELKFSSNPALAGVEVYQGEVFNTVDSIKKHFLSNFNFLKTKPKESEDDMKPEELSALTAGLSATLSPLLDEQFSKINDTLAELKPNTDESADDNTDDQYTQLKADHEELKTNFNALQEKITALEKTREPQTLVPEGGEGEEPDQYI